MTSARDLLRGAFALALALAAALAAAPAAGAYIYWSDNGPGLASSGTTIGRANLDASGQIPGLVGTASGPAAIVATGGYIYWANDRLGGLSIGRAAVDGSGANPTFISSAATSGGVYGIATDGTYIYWTDGSRYIGRASLDGTGAVAHFIDMGSSSDPWGIAVSGGIAYVGEFGQIATVPAAGGSPGVLTAVSGQLTVMAVAVAGGYVYWTNKVLSPSPYGSIGRVPVSGIGADDTYVPGLQYPTGVATDGNELYWVDTNAGAIGRGTIGSGGVTNEQPSFITDTAGPAGVAFDTAIDPTHTSVTCNPASVAVASVSACTALVSDSASTSVPSGSVVFAAGASTYFSGGNSCMLIARPGGGASCTVGAASSAAGTPAVTATYAGDQVHSASNGAGQFCAGTTTQCGGSTGGTGGRTGGGTGGGGGTPPPACKVPKLRGKSLSRARKLLIRAHCRLGKVIRPHARPGHQLGPLVVRSVRPHAGRSLANGARVEVWLAVAHPRSRPRGAATRTVLTLLSGSFVITTASPVLSVLTSLG